MQAGLSLGPFPLSTFGMAMLTQGLGSVRLIVMAGFAQHHRHG